MDANSTEAGKSTVLLLRNRERDRESPRREKEEGRGEKDGRSTSHELIKSGRNHCRGSFIKPPPDACT